MKAKIYRLVTGWLLFGIIAVIVSESTTTRATMTPRSMTTTATTAPNSGKTLLTSLLTKTTTKTATNKDKKSAAVSQASPIDSDFLLCTDESSTAHNEEAPSFLFDHGEDSFINFFSEAQERGDGKRPLAPYNDLLVEKSLFEYELPFNFSGCSNYQNQTVEEQEQQNRYPPFCPGTVILTDLITRDVLLNKEDVADIETVVFYRPLEVNAGISPTPAPTPSPIFLVTVSDPEHFVQISVVEGKDDFKTIWYNITVYIQPARKPGMFVVTISEKYTRQSFDIQVYVAGFTIVSTDLGLLQSTGDVILSYEQALEQSVGTMVTQFYGTTSSMIRQGIAPIPNVFTYSINFSPLIYANLFSYDQTICNPYRDAVYHPDNNTLTLPQQCGIGFTEDLRYFGVHFNPYRVGIIQNTLNYGRSFVVNDVPVGNYRAQFDIQVDGFPPPIYETIEWVPTPTATPTPTPTSTPTESSTPTPLLQGTISRWLKDKDANHTIYNAGLQINNDRFSSPLRQSNESEHIFSFRGNEYIKIYGYNIPLTEPIEMRTMSPYRKFSLVNRTLVNIYYQEVWFKTTPFPSQGGIVTDWDLNTNKTTTYDEVISQVFQPLYSPFVLEFDAVPVAVENETTVILKLNLVNITMDEILNQSPSVTAYIASLANISDSQSFPTNIQGLDSNGQTIARTLGNIVTRQTSEERANYRATYEIIVVEGDQAIVKRSLRSSIDGGDFFTQTGLDPESFEITITEPDYSAEERQGDVAATSMTIVTASIMSVVVGAAAAQGAGLTVLTMGSSSLSIINMNVMSSQAVIGASNATLSAGSGAVGAIGGAAGGAAGGTAGATGGAGSGSVSAASSSQTGTSNSVTVLHEVQFASAVAWTGNTVPPFESAGAGMSGFNMMIKSPFAGSYNPESSRFLKLTRTLLAIDNIYDIYEADINDIFIGQLFYISLIAIILIILHLTCYLAFQRKKKAFTISMNLIPKIELLFMKVIHMGVFIGGFRILRTSNEVGLRIMAFVVITVIGVGFPVFVIVLLRKKVAPYMNKIWMQKYFWRHLIRGGWSLTEDDYEKNVVKESWKRNEVDGTSNKYFYVEQKKGRCQGIWFATSTTRMRYGDLFEHLRGQYYGYTVFEMSMIALEGSVVGLLFDFPEAQAGFLVAAGSLEFLVLGWLWPYNDWLEQIIQMIIAALNIAVTALLLAIVRLVEDDPQAIVLSNFMLWCNITAVIIATGFAVFVICELMYKHRVAIRKWLRNCSTNCLHKGSTTSSSYTESSEDSFWSDSSSDDNAVMVESDEDYSEFGSLLHDDPEENAEEYLAEFYYGSQEKASLMSNNVMMTNTSLVSGLNL